MLSPGGLSTLYSSRIETYLGLINNMPFPWVDIRCGPNPAAYAEHTWLKPYYAPLKITN